MCNLCMDALDSLQDHTANKLSQIVQLEQKNDDMTGTVPPKSAGPNPEKLLFRGGLCALLRIAY